MELSTEQHQALLALVQRPDPLLKGLDCYVVGGAVRDTLLQLPVGDRDWVVVGATPEQLAQRGFIPVGGDFPVFLHPRTKEEFALARTERKSGRGYKGFTFYTGQDVSLADDLVRRDLTINAMALDTQGQFYDPLNGYADIQQRCLRHVGQAFAEDPVRLLRLARFAARFSDFTIAPETWVLARHLVDSGEVDALVPERVWQELYKGLKTSEPGRMLQVLQQCGALARVLPDLLWNAAAAQAVACGVQRQLSHAQCFALLCSQSPNPAQLADHIRAPSAFKDLARLLPNFIHDAKQPLEVATVARALHTVDSLRKPERFVLVVQAAQCILSMDLSFWLQAAQCFAAVDAGAIAKAHQEAPKSIPEVIWAARLEALSTIF